MIFQPRRRQRGGNKKHLTMVLCVLWHLNSFLSCLFPRLTDYRHAHLLHGLDVLLGVAGFGQVARLRPWGRPGLAPTTRQKQGATASHHRNNTPSHRIASHHNTTRSKASITLPCGNSEAARDRANTQRQREKRRRENNSTPFFRTYCAIEPLLHSDDEKRPAINSSTPFSELMENIYKARVLTTPCPP